jgi:thiamine-monophosphate kinase
LSAADQLVEGGIRVAIDISDGLFIDAARLLGREAGAGAVGGPSGLVIDEVAIPVADGVRTAWPETWLELVGGGEDYELLFAGELNRVTRTCERLAAAEVPASVIGVFDEGDGVRVRRDGGEGLPPPVGYEHFGAGV